MESQTPAIWKKNPKQAIIELKHIKGKDVEVIGLDGGIFMEDNVKNNVWNKKKK